MTEEDAKTKWCPFVRYVVGNGDEPDDSACNTWLGYRNPEPCRCIASACMAWRWRDTPNPDWKPETTTSFPDHRNPLSKTPYGIPSTTEGYCGLAGRP